MSTRAGPNAATPAPARRLSPTSRPGGGLGPMLRAQVGAELRSGARVPEFLIGTVAIPVMLFLMFGVPNARFELPGGTSMMTLMMPSFGAFGILSLVIFSFGVEIANERGRGWLRLMRATPVPAWVYFAGKLAMTLAFGIVLVAVLFAAGAAVGVRMPLERWAAAFGILLLGGMSLSTIGFALGYLARPRTASTIANLVYLPLSFASGFFFPLSQLPAFLQDIAPYLPTYHYGRLVWAAIGPPEAVTAFTGIAPGNLALHVTFLIGTFVTFGVLALWGYGRDRSREAA
jgi:ABC-2 type transport system permease protein